MVKGGQVGFSLRSLYQDLGIRMKVEIQSDSSTATSLTDRSVCRIRIPVTVDPTLHYKMKVTKPVMDLVKDCNPEKDGDPTKTQRPDVITRKQEHRNRQLSTLIVNIDTDVQAE